MVLRSDHKHRRAEPFITITTLYGCPREKQGSEKGPFTSRHFRRLFEGLRLHASRLTSHNQCTQDLVVYRWEFSSFRVTEKRTCFDGKEIPILSLFVLQLNAKIETTRLKFDLENSFQARVNTSRLESPEEGRTEEEDGVPTGI